MYNKTANLMISSNQGSGARLFCCVNAQCNWYNTTIAIGKPTNHFAVPKKVISVKRRRAMKSLKRKATRKAETNTSPFVNFECISLCNPKGKENPASEAMFSSLLTSLMISMAIEILELHKQVKETDEYTCMHY